MASGMWRTLAASVQMRKYSASSHSSMWQASGLRAGTLSRRSRSALGIGCSRTRGHLARRERHAIGALAVSVSGVKWHSMR